MSRKPVSVEVKPIMISSTSGPNFSVFSVIWIGGKVLVSIGICPIGKALKTIRIKTRVK